MAMRASVDPADSRTAARPSTAARPLHVRVGTRMVRGVCLESALDGQPGVGIWPAGMKAQQQHADIHNPVSITQQTSAERDSVSYSRTVAHACNGNHHVCAMLTVLS